MHIMHINIRVQLLESGAKVNRGRIQSLDWTGGLDRWTGLWTGLHNFSSGTSYSQRSGLRPLRGEYYVEFGFCVCHRGRTT